jgi:hypothetical protein
LRHAPSMTLRRGAPYPPQNLKLWIVIFVRVSQ